MIPLCTSTWGAEEIKAVHAVLASGQYTMGERVKRFEEAYAKYCGTRYCVAVNSGSSANLLMVAAHTLRHGKGTVLVPAVGWSTSYSPFQQYGWKLVFVDIDRDTLNYDVEQLKAAAALYKPEAILAINLLGNPNDFDEFPTGIPVLEDNCESMGASYMGRMCGSFGTMGTHSTFFSHHICTMEGGMITTDDEHYRDMLLALRSHGWTRHLSPDNVLGAEVSSFHFILPGYNVRPTEMQAAIGLAQLDKLDGFVQQRRKNAEAFPYKTQKETTSGESSWFGFAVFGDDKAKVKGKYETRPVVTGNFLKQPVIQYYDYEVFGKMRNADWVHDNAVMVGNSHKPVIWA